MISFDFHHLGAISHPELSRFPPCSPSFEGAILDSKLENVVNIQFYNLLSMLSAENRNKSDFYSTFQNFTKHTTCIVDEGYKNFVKLRISSYNIRQFKS